MPPRTYAVMGATGKIGQGIVEELLTRGHVVRAIGRNKGKLAGLQAKGATAYAAEFDDAAALARAFDGAEAVFAMIPPGYDQEDFGAYQDRVGQAIVQALQRAKVAQVLSLSSLGAQWPSGTGPIAGLHRQEKRLSEIPGLKVLHFRPGYFMENQLWSIPTIKQHGVNGSPMRGDVPVWMVATRDIAVKAAEFLDKGFHKSWVVEFAGPRPYTLAEATGLLGKAIGQPDLKYVQFPEDETSKAMLGMGMKPSIVGLMLEMQRAFNARRIEPEGRLVQGKTTFEDFAASFAQAYRAPASATA